MAVVLSWRAEARAVSWIMAICAIAFLAFAFLCFLSWRACRRSVSIDPNGICLISPRAPDLFLRWDEIAAVKERPLMQRLVVSDLSGCRRINLEYQLRDFEELRRILLELTRSRTLPVQLPNAFHTSISAPVILTIAVIFWGGTAYLSFKQGATGSSLFFVGFGVFTLAAMFFQVRAIRILANDLVLEFVLRRQVIPLKQIADVRLKNVSVRWNSVALVIVEQANGKRLRLGGVREGSILLYEALSDAWRKAKSR